MPQLTTDTGQSLIIIDIAINERADVMLAIINSQEILALYQENNPSSILKFFQEDLLARTSLPKHANGRALTKGEYSEKFLIEEYKKLHQAQFDYAFTIIIYSIIEARSREKAHSLSINEKSDLLGKIKTWLIALQPTTQQASLRRI